MQPPGRLLTSWAWLPTKCVQAAMVRNANGPPANDEGEGAVRSTSFATS
jgi:hypothetical protein